MEHRPRRRYNARVRYRILSELRGNLVMLEDAQTQTDFVIDLEKLAKRPEMIAGLLSEEAFQLGYWIGLLDERHLSR